MAVDQPGSLCFSRRLFLNEREASSTNAQETPDSTEPPQGKQVRKGASAGESSEFPVHSPGGEARHFIRTCSTLGIRTTTWDVNGMPGGVSCLPSPGQHCGHPSCRLVPSWQQDLSLCGPLPLTGIETGLVALIGPCHLLAAPVPAFAPDGAQGFPGDGRAVAGPRFFSRPRRDSHPSQSASAPNLADELSGRAPVPRKPALFALGGGSASKLIKGYSYLRAG